ncbi:MAG: hypothetical protein KAX19_00475 [Candidatus Brocadiae bacterium]|nr:hypothetical protein [Candidatus Brocadiia bacterium]
MDTGTPRRRDTLCAALLAGAIAVAILVTGQTDEQHYSLEARQRTALAADVIAGASRGTQGLVGSLYLAPLPTVLIIFASLLPLVRFTPALSSAVAAGATVCLAVYINGMWRRHGVRAALRYPAMLGLLLLPPVALSIQSGQTVMLFVALVVCGAGALTAWLREPTLRQLALSALLLGMAVATRYQGALFVLGATLLVAMAALARRRSWSFLEATVLTFILPAVYVVVLWIGGNWLILGDPLFFLKAVSGPLALGTADLRTILTWDCPWLLVGIVALFALGVPVASALARARRGALLHQFVAGAAVGGIVAAAWLADIPTGLRTAPLDVRRVVRFLEDAYPNGTFIVTGYAGYGFVETAAPDPQYHWVHIMHLEPKGIAKVLEDYRGREVFLLVNAAETRDRWDEVGLSWQAPGSRIPERFLFARQVAGWTVFEVLREMP